MNDYNLGSLFGIAMGFACSVTCLLAASVASYGFGLTGGSKFLIHSLGAITAGAISMKASHKLRDSNGFAHGMSDRLNNGALLGLVVYAAVLAL